MGQRKPVRRWIRWTLIPLCFAMILGISGWVLIDRFIVEHVQISGIRLPRVSCSIRNAISAEIKPSQCGISVKRFFYGSGDAKVTYFVADITTVSGASFLACFAKDEYGQNIRETTSAMAERTGASFAVNGDYYGYRTDGIIIRNGVLYRDSPARSGLAIFKDGHMETYNEADTSGQELLQAGVWNTYSFGPTLIADGEACAGLDQPYKVDSTNIQNKQPRTAIGMIAPNHFIIVVVDGRQKGYSCGMTFLELARVFIRYHCQVAYNLDGGKSATMYYGGKVVNSPCSIYRERSVSDALCVN